MKNEKISKRVTLFCSLCSKQMRVVFYTDGSYRGGHYFGDIPLYSKSETKKMVKGGTHMSKIGKMKIAVYNYDPKPNVHESYWECSACFRKSTKGYSRVNIAKNPIK